MKSCVHCHSTNFHPVFTSYGFDRPTEHFDVVECGACKLVTLSPLPGDDELKRYYSEDYYGGGASGKFSGLLETAVQWANHARAAELVAEWTREGKGRADGAGRRVLDIGCGRGYFLRSMADDGFECYGTELSTFPAGEIGGGGKIRFMQGTFEDLSFEESFLDLISIWHVLEHVRDPATTLRKISRTLKPGGMLALAVPNYSSLQRMIFGRHWFHLDLPRHLYHFRRDLMLNWLGENGLMPVKVKTFSAEQNLFGFIQSCMNVLFATRSPNAFYSLMKTRKLHRSGGERMAFWGCAALAVLIFPLSLVEAAVSTVTGKGATLIIYARKTS
jgi:2-polyprenyl-3-methyl-5-hydroxy-6-metoxy-1,4-benzoquinol methylase